MTDLAKEIWQTMRTNKLRTILTGLSVAWGIFMLILLLAISNGVINSTQEFTINNDPYRITIWGGQTTLPYEGYKEGRKIELKGKHFDKIKEEAAKGTVTSVDGEIKYTGQISTDKDYLDNGECSGVYPDYFNGHYKIRQGRTINDNDIREKRKVVILDTASVAKLFDNPKEAVGKTVKIGKLGFTLIGVYEHSWESTPFIPFTTAHALKGYDDKLSEMTIHLSQDIKDAETSAQIEENVRHTLSKAERFAPGDPSAVHTYDRFASYLNNKTAETILNTTMWVIGILTLITGIVGVSNIMFVSVKERTHEIGVRRAIGAKPSNILIQVVAESIALTTCFGYIGIVMGTFATEIVKRAFEGSDFMLNPTVDLSIALEVTVALIIAGALAGIFPALKAIKVKPVEALRDE